MWREKNYLGAGVRRHQVSPLPMTATLTSQGHWDEFKETERPGPYCQVMLRPGKDYKQKKNMVILAISAIDSE